MSKMTLYEKHVLNRSKLKYLLGLLSRWKMNRTYARARKIARKRGAMIGDHAFQYIDLLHEDN